MNVGFIGVGSMGAAMVPNLVRADHRVSVWNRNAAAAEALDGVTVLASPAASFDNDAVLTMLSDDKAVRSVIIESGALASARKGCIHVMMATISLVLVEELQTLHRDAGITYVSAPVFGVPAAAAKAQLNILAAGHTNAIATVQPLFEAMGEATALTETYGLKAADFLNILTNTLFASPSYQRYGGFIGSNTYEPGFKLTLGFKDVNLAFEAADAKGTTLPAATIVRENMQAAINQGLGDKDWSILAKMARRRAGLNEDEA